MCFFTSKLDCKYAIKITQNYLELTCPPLSYDLLPPQMFCAGSVPITGLAADEIVTF